MASNGAFQCGSAGTRFAQITDGLSNTILVGEKHVALRQFGVGWCDCSTYDGDNYVCSSRQFGFGDGGVRMVSASIDPYVLGLLCNASDGEVIPSY